MRVLIFSFYFLLCILESNNCIAQGKAFVPGFYIDQKGDTVKGYGFIKKGHPLAAFKFKTQLLNTISTVSFDSCKLLSLGGESFINWFGPRSMVYIDKMDFTIRNRDSTITSTIPLQLLHKGNRLSLYHYFDVKDHFFIEEGNSIRELAIIYKYVTDLEKQTIIINLPKYIITPVYQNQIVAVLNPRPTKKQMMLIERSVYEKRSLVKLFRALEEEE